MDSRLFPMSVKSSISLGPNSLHSSNSASKFFPSPSSSRSRSPLRGLQLTRCPTNFIFQQKSDETVVSEHEHDDGPEGDEVEYDEMKYPDLESDDSDCSSDTLSLLNLVTSIEQTDEDILLVKHGYTLKYQMCCAVQGEVWMGETKSGDLVVIKKVCRTLHERNESKQDEGITYLVEHDIFEESDILKTLNADWKLKSKQGIVRYLNLIQSDSFVYLVTAYVDGVTLNELINIAHRYIEEGKMRHCDWSPLVKDIMFEIVTVINELHTIHHCCHLDLRAENIKINGITIDEHDDGSVYFDGEVLVTLLSFSAAEMFTVDESMDTPEHSKKRSSLLHSCRIHNSPESLLGIEFEFNTFSADMWSIGMILYEAMVGVQLFESVNDEAYATIHNGELRTFLEEEQLLHLFETESLSLLEGLLDTKSSSRLNSFEAKQHFWFNPHLSSLENNSSSKPNMTLSIGSTRNSLQLSRQSVFECTALRGPSLVESSMPINGASHSLMESVTLAVEEEDHMCII